MVSHNKDDCDHHDPIKEHFDMNTFLGRFSHNCKLVNPFNLLYTSKTLDTFKQNLKNYEETGKSQFTTSQLCDQHYIVKANCHPETNEEVPLLFRWAGFVPVNIPIILGNTI